jgi:hypothetical protein
LPARYVPPSGFGYPLDGFLPSIPCRFCFTPAALMGFTLRSFPLSEGVRYVSVRKNPPTVAPAGIPYVRRGAGAAGCGSWGLTLPRVPGEPRVFSTPPAGCSLGFRPSRVLPTQAAAGTSPDFLSRASQTDRSAPGAPEYRSTRVAPHPASQRAARPHEAALVGFLHPSVPWHSSDDLSGLWVHLAQQLALLRTAHALWMNLALPELSGSA